jgi:hypothetical protein
MKIIVDLNILCNASGNTYRVGKEYKTDLIPMVGMQLEDSAWKTPRLISHITISPTEGYYYLCVGEDTRDNEEQCETLKQMYRSHGWTRLDKP